MPSNLIPKKSHEKLLEQEDGEILHQLLEIKVVRVGHIVGAA